MKRSVLDDTGQTLMEYGVLLAVVVVGVLLAATWTSLATLLQATMSAVAGAL